MKESCSLFGELVADRGFVIPREGKTQIDCLSVAQEQVNRLTTFQDNVEERVKKFIIWPSLSRCDPERRQDRTGCQGPGLTERIT